MTQIENADLDLVATINKTPEGHKGILKLRDKVYQIVPDSGSCNGCCFNKEFDHGDYWCSEASTSNAIGCGEYAVIFKEYSDCPEKEYQGDIDYSKDAPTYSNDFRKNANKFLEALPTLLAPEYDFVNKPKHYMLIPEKDIEVRDLMKVLADRLEGNEYPAMFISDYIQMQQYLLRFDQKNGKEDLEKAKWYLEKLIEELS